MVLTGAGEQAFCAGADLKDMRAGDDSQQTFRPPMGQVERSVFEVALETKKPVIAALNGSAVAGGFELAWPAICASPIRTRSSACPKRKSAWARISARCCCRA